MGVRAISKDGEAGIAHGRGGGTVVERSGGGQPEASRWNNKMRIPDENGGKDRRATFDDVGDHNVTTKTILGARVRQQVGVPHGAHHRRILEGEKKRGRGIRGPGWATASASHPSP